ncbi:nicotinate-nucleotide adenylyltransferase [Denitromonas ohlonensis]|jgi:nicotinate-nucleotide adenylyltransferase|uniref:Probable nicotinate-nucleotide adenylyltransferase n=2 Tax=Denitromonas TaxID=139331 RepID=A0A557SLF4_9RHOO|nr:nicotinate-nucleotide adenylyltransferase [Denitromonas ohlonensis]TVO67953.1 nicotinate-nucleotide adenylyltransferase [Denitromonas ohlonensis]TVO78142.1 nicotinate-nucleotide adenylyltransferase [Denitromonas ohlonensis]TVT68156.1 MAG: nicotinate-nucleotide adenylyltransferase [Denitromonas halophila]
MAEGPIGLLGGTFDPIHIGHLRLAEEARESLGLAELRLIPAGEPPHRGAPRCPGEHRLAMARLAVAGNPLLTVDDSEVRSDGPSYTVLTLERLRAQVGPDRALVLILGADAFEGLPSWHRWNELFDLAHIAVANRPGYAPHGRRWPAVLSTALEAACQGRRLNHPDQLSAAPAGGLLPFDMTPLAISATHIRELLAQGHSARYLLPAPVLDYIAAHSLYS